MPDRPYASIGRRIKVMRELCGFTQGALAERVYVGQAAVSHWETGRRLPNRPTQYLLADALRTPRGLLFKEVAEAEDAA